MATQPMGLRRLGGPPPTRPRLLNVAQNSEDIAILNVVEIFAHVVSLGTRLVRGMITRSESE